MAKLAQLLSVEKSTRNTHETFFTQMFQDVQKSDLLNGFAKTYVPKDENSEKHPPQNKKVQLRAEEAWTGALDATQALLNHVGSRDKTNCVAHADVMVDGKVFLKAVPATHLLYMEHKLAALLDQLNKTPTLSEDESWRRDDALQLWVTDPVEVLSTKKEIIHNVVVPPTPQHPAQVKDDTKDVVVGSWKTVKQSGAMTKKQITDLRTKVEKLRKAVKFAREEANQTPVTELLSGDAVKAYLAE